MKHAVLFCLFFFSVGLVNATHVRSADLKIEPICSGNGLTYRITVLLYLNNGSSSPAGGDAYLNFGDRSGDANGDFEVSTADFLTTPRNDLGENISIATLVTTHTFPDTGTYVISYREGDRSTGILNIFDSEDVDYITFVELVIDANNLCNRIPVLPVPPLDRACTQVAFYHSSGAYDEDGDSLSYELSVPFQSRSLPAQYTSPVDARFYPNIFPIGNEEDTGQPTFDIDPLSGLLTWNAPGRVGEYNIAFKIIEWRKEATTGFYKKLSTTVRDMQIVVEPCVNKKPYLIVPLDTCVVAGTLIHKTIFGTDPENHPVKIEVFGQTLDLDVSPATFTPNPGTFVPSAPPAELDYQWQTDCAHIRSQPYQVVLKITDSPPSSSGAKLVRFKIWNIKVIAPPPVLQTAQLDIAKSQGVLKWDTYTCGNPGTIQIWRKVGPSDYEPGSCAIGVPRSIGYNLIGTVPATQLTFTDTNAGLGLSPGAMYCYRLVAYFDSPAATPSIVSTELCIGPVQADAPIITHVSVIETDVADGSIQVSWRTPFNINFNQFPKQTYEYEVYRADDFIGETNIIKAGRTADTTFLDQTINTQERVFNYRVVLYAQPPLATEKIPVDTSAVASSERLSVTPDEDFITLAWRDSVPWSNVVQSRPYHRIYRGIDDSNPANMELYDSVNVSLDGYVYVDDNALEDDLEYSYYVLTRGTYGNPTIKLQENASQVVSTYTVSDLKPCTPRVTINSINCQEYLQENNCAQTVFSNTLRWSVKGIDDCRKNIQHYNIYVASQADATFVLVASTPDTVYVDAGLPSFARCYKISAVDKLGTESVLSEASCNDNCPFFMLPNVFTPGAEDGANDTFSANFDAEVVAAPEDVTIRCPRFVEQVSFEVYNRWGEQLYVSSTNNGGSLHIEWNGLDKKGRELSSGVYYYTAAVRFNVADPNKQVKEYRGWIKLIR